MSLKLYVWEDALEDYHPGAIFAIANNIREARAAVLAQHAGDSVKRDLTVKPRVLDLAKASTKPEAWLIWGSG